MLLISPERLANRRFRDESCRASQGASGCSSSTRRTASPTGVTTSGPTTSGSARSPTPAAGIALLATTATANDRVVADVEAQSDRTSRSSAARWPGTAWASRRSAGRARPNGSPGWPRTSRSLPAPGSSTPHRPRRPRVSAWLEPQGIDALRTAADSTTMSGCASSAAAARQRGQGTGRHLGARHGLRQARPRFRRPLSAPELGRHLLPADGPRGRALDRADVVLLSGREDDEIAEYFIADAFPPEQMMRDVSAPSRPSTGSP